MTNFLRTRDGLAWIYLDGDVIYDLEETHHMDLITKKELDFESLKGAVWGRSYVEDGTLKHVETTPPIDERVRAEVTRRLVADNALTENEGGGQRG